MQGRGLGTLLIRTMEELAREAGHRVIFIGASRLNLRAQELYQRMGYVPVAEPTSTGARLKPARPRREPGPRWRRWRRRLRWLRWLRRFRRRRREPAVYMSKPLTSSPPPGWAGSGLDPIGIDAGDQPST
jgi:GNAT superfamily N-acetyltransferase